jgi:hypothetical protein
MPDFAGRKWMPQFIAVAQPRRNELRHPIDNYLSIEALTRQHLFPISA